MLGAMETAASNVFSVPVNNYLFSVLLFSAIFVFEVNQHSFPRKLYARIFWPSQYDTFM